MQAIHFSSPIGSCVGSFCKDFEFTLYRMGERSGDQIIGQQSRPVQFSFKNVGERGVFVSTHCFVKAHVEKACLLEFINVLNIEFLFLKAYIAQERVVEIALFSKGFHDQAKTLLLLEDIYFDMNTFMVHELTNCYFD